MHGLSVSTLGKPIVKHDKFSPQSHHYLLTPWQSDVLPPSPFSFSGVEAPPPPLAMIHPCHYKGKNHQLAYTVTIPIGNTAQCNLIYPLTY